ncbi:MAG TPA: glycoside hydrolase domain-containing protein [Longimicrobiaceae bacterium]|nr:glycoside hydrolase domain-containing protein [Longimicrobiaceae bacterium]
MSPGFDVKHYPGTAVMRAWKRESPYQWVGYYLPSPCHRGTSWSGKRGTLERMGWGMGILYVGQQGWDHRSRAQDARARYCSRRFLTAARGASDARDAIRKAASEGFDEGSIVYLNVEPTRTQRAKLEVYYAAWIREMLRDGRYVPGTYSARRGAAGLHDIATAAYRRAGRKGSPPFWISGERGFTLNGRPATSAAPARVWQGNLNRARTWGGHRVVIDEDVATTRNPSTL